MVKFLRREGNYNIYYYECPKCKASGEFGASLNSTQLIEHGCGAMFIQKLTTGKSLYEQPTVEILVEVSNVHP